MFLIGKYKIGLLILLISLYAVIVFKSLFFVLPFILFYVMVNRRNFKNIFFVAILSLLVSINNYVAAMHLIFYGLFVFAIVGSLTKFKEDIYRSNAYIFLFFISFLFIFSTPYNSDSFLNFFLFKDRLWFEIYGNNIGPNVLGVLSALSFIYFYNYKNIPFSVLTFYIFLMTQSRGALLFLIIYMVVISFSSYKRFIATLVLSLFPIYFIFATDVFSRLKDVSLNGREDRIYWANLFIEKNFPLGYTYEEMNYFINHIGTTDNLYYHILVKYGIFGILFLMLLVSNFIFSSRSLSSIAIILAFLVYGLVEESIMSNLIFLMFFGLAIFDRKMKEV
ncbi:O-antigen ligase family protein [Acinetobacter sp. SwsAc4]|uniref:O-antigen ligase family protein n=1 Tax=Acinetobacter sp. SwsAc4 TaxID=2749437 RepID=UPI0015B8440A|nr:O-antigen ligase family protein [Acinetobacter sp. SwsAc4]NWK82955.1 hypothetical protein [Acinetobacter sp. SwsAc4]